MGSLDQSKYLHRTGKVMKRARRGTEGHEEGCKDGHEEGRGECKGAQQVQKATWKCLERDAEEHKDAERGA